MRNLQFWLVLGTAFWAVSCGRDDNFQESQPSEQDSGTPLLTCADLTCGDNAACRQEPGQDATCVCAKGYLGDGDACEMDGQW
ncbi:MAG: EGF-like domain-containing protein, partial [Polyangiaceae bacterium]|nr:EGF-like domain-containing protein [Polyangiaceae bacterium]